MNDRIKDLFEQACFETEYDDVQNLKEMSQRFAELIVRECADIAREVGTNTEPDNFALDRCYEIEDKIKEHFGVE